MPKWDFTRNISSVRLMVELAQTSGVSPAQILNGTRLQVPQLTDPSIEVTAEQELQLTRNLVAALGHDPLLGLKAGQCYRFTAFGALGFAMVSSRSLREALDIGLRYFHLTFAFAQFSVEDLGAHTAATLDDREIPEPVRRFLIERDMVAFITLQRDIFGTEQVLRQVSFAFPPPAEAAPYTKFFGVPPRFGAVRNTVLFDREQLLRPLPQANPLAQQMAEAQCRQLLDARHQRSGLSARVRNAIAARLQQGATMEAIARALNMIPRTLRRRLQEEGTTYAELRDEVRQTLAEEFLSGPRLSMDQIADRLGYSEATAFINAFRRWHGTTPHAMRLQSPSPPRS